MSTRIGQFQIRIPFISTLLIFQIGLILIISFIAIVRPIPAQTSPEDWFSPLNISGSGSTSDPIFFIDSQGGYHVFWADEFSGTMYASLTGEEWSTPQAVQVPFPTTDVHFIIDSFGRVHAFWITEFDRLLYTRSQGTGYKSSSNWTPILQLGRSAINFDISLDDSDGLHLVYVNPSESENSPAGVYYRRSVNGGGGWSTPGNLFDSPYFRSLTDRDANIAIDSRGIEEETSVYVTWDLQPRNQIFFLRSDDRGQTWDEITELFENRSISSSVRPINPDILTTNHQLIWTWQAGALEGTCQPMYQVSQDNGATWGQSQAWYGSSLGCPEDSYYWSLDEHSLVSLFFLQSLPYLIAWNGEDWSEPRFQPELSGFADTTTFDLVEFGCHQPILGNDFNLQVIACDEGSGGDIWLLSRTIESTDSWFPSPSEWTDPELVYSTNHHVSNLGMEVDSNENLHSVWVMTDPSDNREEQGIFYSSFDGDRWTTPILIFQTSNDGSNDPSIAIDQDDRLHLVWSDIDQSIVNYSIADAARARNPEEWAEPKQISSPGQLSRSPDIFVSITDEILIAYAIPLNENRGIYLSRSIDRGINWDPPEQIFDAVSAGWEHVDDPKISQTADGTVHVNWIRATVPGASGPLALYYNQKKRSGTEWDDPEIISKSSISSNLISNTPGEVHQIWIDERWPERVLWHVYSSDVGNSWTSEQNISNLSEDVIATDAMIDLSGDIHLIFITEGRTNEANLRHVRWDDGNWTSLAELTIDPDETKIQTDLSSSISNAGEVNAVLINLLSLEGEAESSNILLTSHNVELGPIVTPIAPVTRIPTETQAPSEVAIRPTSSPTLAVVINLDEPTNEGIFGNGSNDSLLGSLVGIMAAGTIVLLTFVVVLRRGKIRRHY